MHSYVDSFCGQEKQLRNGQKDLFRSCYYKRGKHENVLQNVEIAHKDYGLYLHEKYKLRVMLEVKYIAMNILNHFLTLLSRVKKKAVDQKMVLCFIMDYIHKYQKVFRSYKKYFALRSEGIDVFNSQYASFIEQLLLDLNSFRRPGFVSSKKLEEVYETRRLYNENGEEIDDLGRSIRDDLDLKKRLSRNLFSLRAANKKRKIEEKDAARQRQNLCEKRKLCLSKESEDNYNKIIGSLYEQAGCIELDANWVDKKKLYSGSLSMRCKFFLYKCLESKKSFYRHYIYEDEVKVKIDQVAPSMMLSSFNKKKRILLNGANTYYFLESPTSQLIYNDNVSLNNTELCSQFLNLINSFLSYTVCPYYKKIKEVDFEWFETICQRFIKAPTKKKQIDLIKFLLHRLSSFEESGFISNRFKANVTSLKIKANNFIKGIANEKKSIEKTERIFFEKEFQHPDLESIEDSVSTNYRAKYAKLNPEILFISRKLIERACELIRKSDEENFTYNRPTERYSLLDIVKRNRLLKSL